MLGTVTLVVAALVLALLALWLYGERWRLLRPSTWKTMREAGLRRFLTLNSLYMYLYARWPTELLKGLDLVMPHLGPGIRKWFADTDHIKVLTPELARAIITVDQDIPLRDLEQIIPYPMARDLVLSSPPDLAVFHCACREAQDSPCQPVQVCITIGESFVDFLLEHHPEKSRRLTQAEALELLQAEHERGHVHSARFANAFLGRFFTLCNCCKCCCAARDAVVTYDTPMIASSGFVAQVDQTRCTACSICEEACLFEAVQVDGTAVVNWDLCMGCGVCVDKCPNEARSLVRDEKKGVPLDVRALAQEQAVP